MGKRLVSLLFLYKQEFIILTLAILTILIFVPVFTYLYFASDLKSKEGIMNRNNTGIVLLDREGEPFFRFYEGKYSRFVPLKDLPPYVKHAVLAAEDKDFYHHPGFSLYSILGAVIANIKHGDLSYGGSTITQQLVKSALLTPRKSFLRKFQEVVLAQELERKYSKDEILEMYLNSVYFGEGAFGVESASEVYFGKHAAELTVSEASVLAGLLTAPSLYSPISGDRGKLLRRQEFILSEMEAEGVISSSQRQEALRKPLQYAKKVDDNSLAAPHFALMVRDQLIKQYGEERIARSGFVIYTTLDMDWQEIANRVVAQQVKSLRSLGGTNASVVVIDPPTGEVRVLVGSENWLQPQFGKVNMATTPRQPGSSFKPLVYARALELSLITPATILRDERTTFPGNYTPLDYDRKFRGPVLVRRALANSLNVPAVEVLRKVGLNDALQTAKRFGIQTLSDKESDYGLSLVLGTGVVRLTELTNVYAMFANQGRQNPLTLISKIEDKYGHTVYTYKPQPKQVVDPQVAFLISSILSDNLARAEAFGNALTISRPAAVKTGTTEDYRDALTLGFTPHLAVGVWVGNNDNKPMTKIAGSLGAAPIWKQLMETYLKGKPIEKFTVPDGVIQLSICSSNGYLFRSNISTSSARREYFIKGSEPAKVCYSNGTQPVNRSKASAVDPPPVTISVTPSPPPTQ